MNEKAEKLKALNLPLLLCLAVGTSLFMYTKEACMLSGCTSSLHHLNNDIRMV